MGSQIEMYTGTKVESEIFNKLVDKTVEIMKMEIVQAIIETNDQATTTRKISKFSKKEQLRKAAQPITVGTVVANRFKAKNTKVKNVVMKNISSLKKVEPQLVSKVSNSNLKVLSDTSVFKQIDLRKEYAFLSQKKHFNELIKQMDGYTGKNQGQRIDIREFLNDNSGSTTNPSTGSNSSGSTTTNPINNSNNDNQNTNTEKPKILNKGLKFKLNRVKCVDETNPEWPGSDEINMGGVTIDDKGREETINEFEVYDDFDEGEQKVYNPPKELKYFYNLDASYPKSFTVILAMAEMDSDGLGGFVTDLYNAVKGELETIVTGLAAAAGAAIAGSELGASIGVTAGPIGAIIGAAVGAILGAIFAWIANALSEDTFPPQVAIISMESGVSTFDNGSLVSPVQSLYFSDHGGEYRVDFSWEIVR